jgi:hypothetical protein
MLENDKGMEKSAILFCGTHLCTMAIRVSWFEPGVRKHNDRERKLLRPTLQPPKLCTADTRRRWHVLVAREDSTCCSKGHKIPVLCGGAEGHMTAQPCRTNALECMRPLHTATPHHISARTTTHNTFSTTIIIATTHLRPATLIIPTNQSQHSHMLTTTSTGTHHH